ncbi:hypothetical protein FQN57_000348 [Myotisia sp. PD_48]|nr:hypothetical protein FQN57_000348 [Myotisia sp. PD_48]
MHFNLYAIAALSAAGSAFAHMEMDWPYPLRSRNNPGGGVDYDNKSPMASNGANYPCRGHHRNTPFKSVITYQAGQSYNISLNGSARHAGGSCQISLSYDNGASFKVIKSIMGGCPLVDEYDFTIPADVPSGNALLAWSWFNLVGNREMYMNCAHVTIQGGSGSGANLPAIFKANVGGSCRTAEGKETVFANPGPQVQYGGKVTASSPVFPNC